VSTLQARVRLVSPVAGIVMVACSTTVHSEYHPEARFSFVQNIAVGVPEEPDHCELGRAPECWRGCFARSRGAACYALAVMFETGHGIPLSHDNARRMAAVAARLGYAPAAIDVDMAAPYVDLWSHAPSGLSGAPVPRSGEMRPPVSVTSTGGLVVYGSVSGDVFLGR